MKTFIITSLFLFLFVSLASAIDFTFTGDDFFKAGPVEEHIFHPVIQNNESESVKFNIIGYPDIPDEWFWQICSGGICFPGDSGFVFINGGESKEVEIHFRPLGVNGGGSSPIRIYPEGYPEESVILTFGYMAEPVIILVDDDGGENYETYYRDALANLLGGSISYGVWDRSVEGFDDEDLAY